jgi:hypothetical protein
MKYALISWGVGRRLQVDCRCAHILNDVIPLNLGVDSPLVSVIVTGSEDHEHANGLAAAPAPIGEGRRAIT